MSSIRRKVGSVLIGVVALLLAVFYIYTQDFYEASEYVSDVMVASADRIVKLDNLTLVIPDKASDIGLIFYPGGKVEVDAYMPLMIQLSDLGINCLLVEMPFNLAVFDKDAADKARASMPNIETWYLAGHSLGGAMASTYIGEASLDYEGLILLGSYPVNDASIDSLVIYGTYDGVVDLDKTGAANEVYEIVGGNHAYFGDYGEQDGDGTAQVSRLEQQRQTVQRISAYIFE